MAILSALAEIIRDLLIFVGALAVLLVGLVVIISRLSRDNPLKRKLTQLSYRIGATLIAGMVAVPVEPIPGVDIAYDVGVSLLLILYWLSFFRGTGRALTSPLSGPPRAGH
jgi:hypothetical protein